MAKPGFIVVSGLARGIDTAAHEASLESGTVAVLAGGLDQIYPPQNLPLLERLLEQGAAISEMPLGWVARGRDFPRRNRLVSGLSLGTVVMEAARKSGSLITARFANEQGRLVFAVPGSPLDPRAEGGNHLIREGATLVTEADHVIEALAPLRNSGSGFGAGGGAWDSDDGAAGAQALWDELNLPEIQPAPLAAVGPESAPDGNESLPVDGRERLLNLLGSTPISLDDLVRSSGCAPRDVSRWLFELELDGAVSRQPGGLFSRAVR